MTVFARFRAGLFATLRIARYLDRNCQNAGQTRGGVAWIVNTDSAGNIRMRLHLVLRNFIGSRTCSGIYTQTFSASTNGDLGLKGVYTMSFQQKVGGARMFRRRLSIRGDSRERKPAGCLSLFRHPPFVPIERNARARCDGGVDLACRLADLPDDSRPCRCRPLSEATTSWARS